MISTPFEYTRATSLDDALAKLGAANGDGKLIAGGHSLVPLMKLRLSEPKVLIDIARIPGMSGVGVKDGMIDIRAGTVHHDVATSDLLQRTCPVVAETAADIGDPQVRNRGTIGGSLAHADPAADYPAVMLALDAEIHVKGPGGWRLVKAPDFFQAMFTVDLAANEIIAGVQFKPIKSAAYAKLYQRDAAIEMRKRVVGIQTDGLVESPLSELVLLLLHHHQPEHMIYDILPVVYLARALKLFERLVVFA